MIEQHSHDEDQSQYADGFPFHELFSGEANRKELTGKSVFFHNAILGGVSPKVNRLKQGTIMILIIRWKKCVTMLPLTDGTAFA